MILLSMSNFNQWLLLVLLVLVALALLVLYVIILIKISRLFGDVSRSNEMYIDKINSLGINDETYYENDP